MPSNPVGSFLVSWGGAACCALVLGVAGCDPTPPVRSTPHPMGIRFPTVEPGSSLARFCTSSETPEEGAARALAQDERVSQIDDPNRWREAVLQAAWTRRNLAIEMGAWAALEEGNAFVVYERGLPFVSPPDGWVCCEGRSFNSKTYGPGRVYYLAERRRWAWLQTPYRALGQNNVFRVEAFCRHWNGLSPEARLVCFNEVRQAHRELGALHSDLIVSLRRGGDELAAEQRWRAVVAALPVFNLHAPFDAASLAVVPNQAVQQAIDKRVPERR